MSLNTVLNILYPILAVTAAMLVAHTNRLGFLLFLIVEGIVITIGVQVAQWGVVGMGIMYIFIHSYSYHKWGKQHEKYKSKEGN